MPCCCYVRQLADFETIGVSFLSTHIKSLTGLPRRGKMSVESKIRKNKKSRRDVILTLSVTSVFKSFIVQLFLLIWNTQYLIIFRNKRHSQPCFHPGIWNTQYLIIFRNKRHSQPCFHPGLSNSIRRCGYL